MSAGNGANRLRAAMAEASESLARAREGQRRAAFGLFDLGYAAERARKELGVRSKMAAYRWWQEWAAERVASGRPAPQWVTGADGRYYAAPPVGGARVLTEDAPVIAKLMPEFRATPDLVAAKPAPAPPSSKAERYGWVTVDQPGRFAWVDKAKLNVDHEYQRKAIRRARITSLARAWSWIACGVLVVVVRPDGTLWVIDGQHRKLAADARDDISQLPCLIFELDQKILEARGFLDSNTNRSNPNTLDKFDALLMSQDETAVAVEAMVRESGYTIAKGKAQRTVQCVSCLMNCVRIDPEIARVAWELAVELSAPEPVNEDIIGGLFALEQHLARGGEYTIRQGFNRKALIDHGVPTILKHIRESVSYNGGGMKANAEGILRLLNKRRSSRRLPSLYTGEE